MQLLNPTAVNGDVGIKVSTTIFDFNNDDVIQEQFVGRCWLNFSLVQNLYLCKIFHIAQNCHGKLNSLEQFPYGDSRKSFLVSYGKLLQIPMERISQDFKNRTQYSKEINAWIVKGD